MKYNYINNFQREGLSGGESVPDYSRDPKNPRNIPGTEPLTTFPKDGSIVKAIVNANGGFCSCKLLYENGRFTSLDKKQDWTNRVAKWWEASNVREEGVSLKEIATDLLYNAHPHRRRTTQGSGGMGSQDLHHPS